MKKMIGALFLLLFASLPAGASIPADEVMALEKQIEERINPILHSFDPTSFSVVRIDVAEEKDGTLPGTPYRLDRMVVRTADGTPKFQRVEISIFGKKTTVWGQVIPVVKGLASRLGVEPVVKVQDASPTGSDANGDGKNYAATFSETNSILKGLLNLSTDSVSFARQAIWWIAGFLIVLFVFIMAGLNAILRRALRGFEKSPESPSTEGAARGDSLPTRAEDAKTPALPPQAIEPSMRENFKSYSEETLVACLSDCYWGEFDTYAAFLWKQIPVGTRSALLSNAPISARHLVGYIAAISELAGVDLGLIDSPAYIKPLPISHLDNRDLCQFVRTEPALLGLLSPLRTRALPLSLTEKVHFREIVGTPEAGFERELRAAPPSRFRSIRRKLNISIASLQEESELLALPRISPDLIEDVPSLGWGLRLSREELSEVLEGFSARDLAQAWIAPDEVLAHFSSCLPAKKFELLKSLEKKVRPGRENDSFRMIHAAVTDRLRKKMEGGGPSLGKEEPDDKGKRAA